MNLSDAERARRADRMREIAKARHAKKTEASGVVIAPGVVQPPFHVARYFRLKAAHAKRKARV